MIFIFFFICSFPKSDEIRMLWLLASNRSESELKPDSCLCSVHFDENSFITDKKKVCLSNNAVPNMGGPSSVSNCCNKNEYLLGNNFLSFVTEVMLKFYLPNNFMNTFLFIFIICRFQKLRRMRWM